MANTVLLEIVTPERLFYRGEVRMVIVRTLTGDEGFMANHTWACKLLDVGEIWIQEAGQQDFRMLAGAKGFIDVRDGIMIFLDAAEWATDIDLDRALSEKERAEQWISQHERGEDEEELVMRAKISIQKQVMRMKVAQGGGRRRR
ncbi:MAG: ATP synthase F1 subunit epsilon [Clostridiales Family XIII bacterium]|jgi:F-type H+-transporting ATPase subunit epsilon|nr:ATP synthase F1 subunit epsilon [Clostridiales Family XIII bacterium]